MTQQQHRSGHGLLPSSRALLAVTAACALAFATGVVPRPDGLAWDRFYDIVLFNGVSLTAAATAWFAGRRVVR